MYVSVSVCIGIVQHAWTMGYDLRKFILLHIFVQGASVTQNSTEPEYNIYHKHMYIQTHTHTHTHTYIQTTLEGVN